MPRQSDPTPSLSRFWNGYVGDCANSVARFRRITGALPAGPARSWLAEIAQRLDAELDAVRRLATVGDSIEPARFRVREEPAKRIAQRLDASRSAFADAVSQAAEVAEQVALDPAHSDVRANLEVLSRQAATLAGAPAPPEPEPEPPRRWWRRRERS
ncbi:hypothetical protein ACU61A_35925 [Pseudonocardia sichuanensis]|uniref:hypothetical protein n=1 Tax=Pseudonocardia kunmingensis TaxID=630975 RepID=UPI00114DC39B|nr:hypothetical protein [Pseudonocardia kunmingensis]